MKYQLIQGDNRAALKHFPDNHFDSIVTDPPYGIDFLGKAWDANTGALETYQECLRVLKPGGHILAFSAARTYHHLAVTLEQAGFEIRDQIMWIYSSGFPKSQDVGRTIQRSLGVKEKKPRPDLKKTGVGLDNWTKNLDGGNSKESGEQTICTDPEARAWAGWGTALKPAHEPIALARKPLKSTIKANVVKWGTGALNIDACRVAIEGDDTRSGGSDGWDRVEFGEAEPNKYDGEGYVPNAQGRFPSNVIGEIQDYQKYFYCPKVSRRERHTGFELPPPMFGNVQGCYGPDGERFAVGFDARAEGKTKKKKHDPLAHIPTNPDGMMSRDEKGQLVNNYTAKKAAVGNNHPTVKPVELMKYLIKLITPQGGKILDPFNGSGSTGMAAVELGFEYVGIDLDEHYIDIATKRIDAWYKQTNPLQASGLFE